LRKVASVKLTPRVLQSVGDGCAAAVGVNPDCQWSMTFGEPSDLARARIGLSITLV
jgi:hypothetical protein